MVEVCLRAPEDEVQVAIPELLRQHFSCAGCADDLHHSVGICHAETTEGKQQRSTVKLKGKVKCEK